MMRAGLAIVALGITVALAGIAEAAQTGMASYYKRGKRTANGERFNPHGYTAAHRTLPFGTKVRVTCVDTGKQVVVTINDRGPAVKGREIDLSAKAARVLGFKENGLGEVKLELLNDGEGTKST